MRYFHTSYKLPQQETTGTHSLDEILGVVLIHPKKFQCSSQQEWLHHVLLVLVAATEGTFKISEYKNSEVTLHLCNYYIHCGVVSLFRYIFIIPEMLLAYNSNGSYDIIPSRLISRPLAPSTNANSAQFHSFLQSMFKVPINTH